MLSRYLQDSELTKGDFFPDKMNVQLDVLGPAMVYWREIHRLDIVALDHHGLTRHGHEARVGDCEANNTQQLRLLPLSTQPRCWNATRRLLLRRP